MPPFIFIVAAAAAFAALLRSFRPSGPVPPVPGGVRVDALGDGHFNAGRNHPGNHEGTDYLAAAGDTVVSPIDGKVTRYADPYNDGRFSGVVIDDGNGTEIRVFYVRPSVTPGQEVEAGQQIGWAQNIVAKYGSPMLNHIHVEVRQNGSLVDPQIFFKKND